jgi:histidinol-phosphate aminotransferase
VELRSEIARFHNRRIEEIIAGNGSAELIDLICRAFVEEGEEVLTSEYSFEKYYISTKLMKAVPVHAPMTAYKYNLTSMAELITPRTRIIFIANPNNPTGTMVTREELENFLAFVPDEVIVVLDEAYFEYGVLEDNYPDSLTFRKKNLITLRTFSKAYGLAGLRIGYLVADTELVEQINHTREAFNTGLFAQIAALEALKDQNYVKETVEKSVAERKRLSAELEKLGMKVYPSATNFLFMESPVEGLKLAAELLKRGLIIRPIANYGLMNHVRISVGLPEQNEKLTVALKEIIG